MPPPRPFIFTTLALLSLSLPGAALAATPGAPASVEAGLGEGVKITAADDSMSLQVRARAQLRGAFTYDEDADEPMSEEFLIRRARLQLRGHMLTRSLKYYIQLGFSNRDMESDLRVPLRDARIHWAFSRDAELMAGQMKVPFNRQRTTSSSALQIMDRSLSNSELNLDRDVGVVLRSGDLFGWGERLGYEAGVFGGDGRNRTTDRGGLLYVARVELAPLGPLLGDEEADLQHSPLRVNVGLAAAYNAGTRRTLSTHGGTFAHGVTDYTHAGLDLAARWRGASLNAELLMRRASDEVLTGEVDGMPASERTRSGWGYLVQGGYLLTDTFELTGRYSAAEPLGVSAVEDAWEAGGGVSWYIHEHALKLQSDYMRLGGADSEGAHQARLQLQFFF